METLLSGLFIAAISGITIIAYKHPNTYNKLFNVMFGFAFFSVIIVLVWDIATSKAYRTFLPIFEAEKLSEGRNLLKSIQIGDYAYLFYILFIIYIAFLRHLPNLIKAFDKE